MRPAQLFDFFFPDLGNAFLDTDEQVRQSLEAGVQIGNGGGAFLGTRIVPVFQHGQQPLFQAFDQFLIRFAGFVFP